MPYINHSNPRKILTKKKILKRLEQNKMKFSYQYTNLNIDKHIIGSIIQIYRYFNFSKFIIRRLNFTILFQVTNSAIIVFSELT